MSDKIPVGTKRAETTIYTYVKVAKSSAPVKQWNVVYRFRGQTVSRKPGVPVGVAVSDIEPGGCGWAVSQGKADHHNI